MKKKMNNKGFSMIELIIVITIMGVLIGLLAPQFIKYVEQSRKRSDVKNAQEIATAVQSAIADGLLTGKKDMAKVENPANNGQATAGSILEALTKGGFLSQYPEIKSLKASAQGGSNPAWGVSYDVKKNEVKVVLSKNGTDFAGAGTPDDDNATSWEVFPANKYTK